MRMLVKETVEPMGYEVAGVELVAGGRRSQVLRIYIDHPDGVQLDDCAAVSHQLSGVLDVEDPIRGDYELEVSSPGLDRPLFEADHFERFSGHRARVRLAVKQDGRRNFEGVIQGMDEDLVILDVEGEVVRLPLNRIDSARLVPEF
ncbi:MAG: ribosome maturation factor RimP [Pseudomonadota bacterium]